ncbi:hypothetical protein [Staphylococcus cohnii]
MKVVNEYLNEAGGYKFLGKKHNVDPSLIRLWVRQNITHMAIRDSLNL